MKRRSIGIGLMLNPAEATPKRRFAFEAPTLLAALVLMLVVSPIVEEFGASSLVINLLWAVIVLAAVLNNSRSLPLRLSAVTLAVVALGTTFLPLDLHAAVPAATSAVLFGLTVGVMLRRVVRAKTVDTDVLSSSIAVYLLFGMVWAMLYTALFHLDPDAFSLPNLDRDYVFVHFVHFSFVTLTTVGYGDILPVSPTARMLANTEGVAGVLYLAVLVARLVGLYQPRSSSPSSS